MRGSTFYASISGAFGQWREDAVVDAIQRDGLARFLGTWVPITTVRPVGERSVSCRIFVSRDVVGVGTDDDYARTPLWPGTFQRVCDHVGAVMPTTRISDLVWRASSTRLPPLPQTWNYDGSGSGTSSARWRDHNAMIDKQLRAVGATRAALVAGHKKDLVLGADARHVAIYGWHQTSGVPIQPYSPQAHDERYSDYSHGCRLVHRDCEIDGATRTVAEVLRDPTLCVLLSDRGPVDARYPGALRPGGGGSSGGGGGSLGAPLATPGALSTAAPLGPVALFGGVIAAGVVVGLAAAGRLPRW